MSQAICYISSLTWLYIALKGYTTHVREAAKFRLSVHTLNTGMAITSDRPDMSGKTQVNVAKYPTTLDLQSVLFILVFLGQFDVLIR